MKDEFAPAFLAAVGNFLFVVGGYFLGKYESDKDFAFLYEAVRHVNIHLKNTETSWAINYRYLREDAKKRGEELPELPFSDYSKVIGLEIDAIFGIVEAQKRKAKIALVVGATCVGVGMVLFTAYSMMI